MRNHAHSQAAPEAAQSTDAAAAKQPESHSATCSHRVVSCCQEALFRYGLLVERQWKLILFATFVLFGLCTFGLKDIRLETKLSNLWITDSGRAANEQNAEVIRQSPSLASVSVLSLIQLVPDGSLTRSQLLAHLRLLQRAVNMKVSLPQLGPAFDAELSLSDLCLKYDVSHLQVRPFIRNIMDSIVPCRIATPLDCFWEGSKLIGPKDAVLLADFDSFASSTGSALAQKYKWSNLDPSAVVDELQQLGEHSRAAAAAARRFRRLFRLLGVGHGYVRRPCLDPSDAACPTAARNASASGSVLRALAGGCSGFAENLARHPLRQLVGGARFDSFSGRLVGGAALRTGIVLKSPSFLLDTYGRDRPWDWSLDKAAAMHRAWRQRFMQLVEEENARHGSRLFLASHEDSQDEALAAATKEARTPQWALVLGACAACSLLSLLDTRSLLHSQLTVGLLSAPLLALSVTAGLGLSCWLRLPADLLAVQILPFLQLGISGFCCLSLAGSCNFLWQSAASAEQQRHVVAQLLQQEGGQLVSLLLVSLAASASLLASPLAALRLLGLHSAAGSVQMGAFCMASCPAVLAADCARRRRLGADVLCCPVGDDSGGVAASLPKQLLGFRAGRLLLLPCLRSRALRAASLLLLLLCSAAGAFCAYRLFSAAGLDPLRIIPSDTVQHLYLQSHRSLFSTSELELRFEKMDYARSQLSIRRFHRALRRLPHVCDTNVLWLDAFRDWLLRLQRSFDDDVRAGRLRLLRNESSFPAAASASRDALLAANLLVQTGDMWHQDVGRLHTHRLVQEGSGLIDADLFYIYLSSWYSQSELSYVKAGVSLLPLPETQIAGAPPYGVMPSQEIYLAQSRLRLCGLNTSERSLQARQQILSISENFSSQGVRHRLLGPLMEAYSPEWQHPARMAAAAALLLISCAAASLLLFCRLMPALLCTCLCLVNLLQLAAVLFAAGVQLNVVTCAAVSLVFPLMHLINVSTVFHTCLAAQPEQPEQPQQQQQRQQTAGNIYTAISLEPEPRVDSGGNSNSSSSLSGVSANCLRCAQACPLSLVAFAAAFAPRSTLLSMSFGVAAVGGAACSAATALAAAPAALRALRPPPHPLVRCRSASSSSSGGGGGDRQGPEAPQTAPATPPPALALRQRSLETISEESGEPSPAATPSESVATASLPCGQRLQGLGHHVISATLHLRLQPDPFGPPAASV